METLNILGTGSAMVTKCYNTCFTISNGDEHFLVDAGGGNTILAHLEKMNIKIQNIHNMFISHNHNDHILGGIWVIRAVGQSILNNKYDGIFNIYGHKSSLDALKDISKIVLQKKFLNLFGERIRFIEVENNSEFTILNRKTVFFDIKSTKLLQFGFKVELENGKTLTFLGDEPYNKDLKSYAFGVDYLLHEAFCLYSEKDEFKPYEKHHATVKDACINARELKVKTILLYHTEDKNILNREKLYIKEGKEEFNGTILVPNDLTKIDL
ncbi:MBL fold metallo-hydrolase [Clostridium thermobutyricum]|uniref:MBL fold metallo-hydrolase n=1 Tax=Clostridium thermobutyricum TaxID=29372 RepID=UPI0018AABC2D|nr:MBL fold metallo-hydrolase [Clostridium thermobutyricum]